MFVRISLLVLSIASATFSYADGSWISDGPIYEINIDWIDSVKNFNSVLQKIPDIKDLGVNTIYLLPIWKCVEGRSYSIINYDTLNTDYGTETDLHSLVDSIHSSGMKVIFDLVIAYTPEESWIFQNHPEWLLQTPEGEPYFWRWGYSIDMSNPDVINYFVGIARHYIEEYGIDGWRVDAPQINYQLGDSVVVPPDYNAAVDLLRAVKDTIIQINPDAILYAEWMGPWCEQLSGSSPDYDEMCEISYNYPFCGWLKPDTSGGGLHWHYLRGFMDSIVYNQTTSQNLVEYLNSEQILYNRTRAFFSECHDGHRVNLAFPDQNRPLLVLISTIPGVPMIQVGQEIGHTRRHAYIDWDSGDYELRNFYKKVFSIRNGNNALKYGDLRNVWSGGDTTYAYMRGYENNYTIVMLNFRDYSVTSTLGLPVDSMGIDPTQEYILNDVLNDTSFSFTGSELESFELTLPAYGSRILNLSGLTGVERQIPKCLNTKIPKLIVEPNPSRQAIIITYSIPQASEIELSIYNIAGQRVAQLDYGFKQAGEYVVGWSAKGFPSGIYFVKLKVGEFSQTKKLLFLRLPDWGLKPER